MRVLGVRRDRHDHTRMKLPERTLKTNATRIILARHGETVCNREVRLMGRSDSPLTPDGIQIAHEVARLVEQQDVKVIYSSPLGRALSSARIYTKNLGIPIFPEDNMAELACGEWEGKYRFDVKPEPGPLRATWVEKPPGGESYRDAEPRVAAFIKHIKGQTHASTTLVVGHAGVNRVFLKLWLGLSPEYAVRIRCPHDTVYVLGDGASVQATSLTGSQSEGLLLDPE